MEGFTIFSFENNPSHLCRVEPEKGSWEILAARGSGAAGWFSARDKLATSQPSPALHFVPFRSRTPMEHPASGVRDG
jgi:hypothetical protein